MNWSEFSLARLHMAEDRVGKHVRQGQREELDQDQQSDAILRSHGMVG